MSRTTLLSSLALASGLGLACVGQTTTPSDTDSGPDPQPQIDAATTPDAAGPETATPEAAPPPPPWAPTDLPGLSLWLRATDGLHLDVNDNVVAWDDQSGHNNTATPVPSAGPRKTLYAGKEAVQYSAHQALQLTDSASLRWNGDFTVVVVAASNQSAMTYGMLYGKSAVPYPYAGPALMVDYPLGPQGYTGAIGGQIDIEDAVVSTANKLDDYGLRAFGLSRTGSSIAVHVNGDAPVVKVMANPPQDTTATGVVGFVGGHPANNTVVQGFEGVILEVIGVDGTLTDPEYAQIWTYVSKRYGL